MARSGRLKKQRRALVERDGVMCWICGEFMPEDDRTLDRIVPGAKGGTYAQTNLRLAHMKCNGKRGGHRQSFRSLNIPQEVLVMTRIMAQEDRHDGGEFE